MERLCSSRGIFKKASEPSSTSGLLSSIHSNGLGIRRVRASRYAVAGIKQRRDPKFVFVYEGVIAECANAKPAFDPLVAIPPKRTPRKVIALTLTSV